MEIKVEQSQNILNWYNFNKNDEILVVGKDLEKLIDMLKQKVKKVYLLDEMKNIEMDKKYNVIVLIDFIAKIKDVFGENVSLENLIMKLEKHLDKDGKFIIALDNKFGLRYFSGDPENILNKKFVSLNGYNNEVEKIETYTKNKLEKTFSKIGYNYNFYYPLPDYKIPDVIFSDKQLPKYNSVDKYNPYHTKTTANIINEIDVFREILKDNPEMFTFFTNSFLIELSKKELDNQYKFISFNNIRKQEYQLITKISDNYVEKQVVNEKAQKHYENIKENIKELEKMKLKTLDYIEDGIIRSKYINQEYMLNNVLTKKLEENDYDEFYRTLNKYIETIGKNTIKIQNYEETVFAKKKIEIENKEIINELNFLNGGLWDLTFKNCFYINDEFYFFDQEWREKNIPVEYILYRSILYTISLRRFINYNDLFEKYKLTKYIDLFKKLDDKFQEEIRDNDIWEYYNESHFIDIDSTKQEVINLQIRNKAQQEAFDKLKEEFKNYKNSIENKISYKIFRKIKRLSGGNNE